MAGPLIPACLRQVLAAASSAMASNAFAPHRAEEAPRAAAERPAGAPARLVAAAGRQFPHAVEVGQLREIRPVRRRRGTLRDHNGDSQQAMQVRIDSCVTTLRLFLIAKVIATNHVNLWAP
jgi:hypothetical protein